MTVRAIRTIGHLEKDIIYPVTHSYPSMYDVKLPNGNTTCIPKDYVRIVTT